MLFRRAFYLLLIFSTVAFITPVFSAEIDGWIKSETCWVTKSPSTDATIVGIILKKAAVTVKDAGAGWYQIVWAPVRYPATGKFLENNGAGYYIQKINFTTNPLDLR